MHKQPKAIIFLGAPGSGKGTQAARLSAALEIPAISTGEMLRRECQARTELGKKLESTLHAGKLVSDDQMNELVERRVARKDCRGGFILDGYPRTVQQAVSLDRMFVRLGFSRPRVCSFEVSAEELIERLRYRRQCATCGRIYGSETPGAKVPVICQNDGSLLTARADDQPGAIRQRLRIYEENSAELIRYYSATEFHRVAAGQVIERVSEELFEALGLREMIPLTTTVTRGLAVAAY
jgi:adenylate kinase